MMDVKLHSVSEVGGTVVRGMVRYTDLAELQKAVTVHEGAGNEYYIEDMTMAPVVRRFLEVMIHLGVSFCNKQGVQYYYIGGKPSKYYGERPSAWEAIPITEVEMRIAVQEHIRSLTGDELYDDMAYIEEKYEKLTGVLFGQMDMYDYIEEVR